MTLLQPVLRPRTRSLWLQEALALEPDAETVAPLAGLVRADLCIVGGGYTGLWTALRAKELDPSLDVVLVEADLCGTGASGRNGGFVTSWWSKLPGLVAKYGEEEGLRLARAASDAVGEIGRFCAEHGVDAHYRPGGWLWAATAAAHVGGWEAAVRLCEHYGIEVFDRLSPAEVARRSGSPMHLAGVWERTAATVQPALLARGLRRVAIERGVRVFERSPVAHVDRGPKPAVHTAAGRVVAPVAVLAINAWAAALPELRRALLPMTSDMIATAPIPERLRRIGWSGDECVADANLMVDYYRTTRDGRIAFGKGGTAHAYLGRISAGFEDPGRRSRMTEAAFRRLYPNLVDVPITHRWTGAVDRTESNTLCFGTLDGAPGIHYGVGYSGNGVGPSLVGARILASRALGRRDEWTASPLNRAPEAQFPPDPIRYFGGVAVRGAVLRRELDQYAGRSTGPLVATLADLAPSGMRHE